MLVVSLKLKWCFILNLTGLFCLIICIRIKKKKKLVWCLLLKLRRDIFVSLRGDRIIWRIYCCLKYLTVICEQQIDYSFPGCWSLLVWSSDSVKSCKNIRNRFIHPTPMRSFFSTELLKAPGALKACEGCFIFSCDEGRCLIYMEPCNSDFYWWSCDSSVDSSKIIWKQRWI